MSRLRKGTRVSAWTMLLCTCMACPLPPDRTFDDDVAENYPPEVDLSQVSPRSPLIELGTTCPTFNAEIGARDLNTELIRLRFVAQNQLPDTRLIADRQLPQPVRNAEVVIPSVHFTQLLAEASEIIPNPDSPTPTAVGVLSAFVTDAPEWALDEDDLQPGVATDLSLLPPNPNGGPSEFSVIEVRWAVAFNQRFECQIQ